MAKVTIIQVIYNNKQYIKPVFDAIFRQAFKDFEVVAVISGNEDGSKEFLQANYPLVKIIDPGYNIGFAKGHNLVFSSSASEFFQLVNPDMIMEPNYIEEMLKAFKDEKVGAATGKLLRYDFARNQKTNIIDTTGVNIIKSGRARDRGQHEVDKHQFDDLTSVQAVSAAGAMYSRKSLENTKLIKHYHTGVYDSDQKHEYYDEDFHSYWEDVDLAWRMSNAGWKCVFVPSAVGYHGRGAGSSEKGYTDVLGFIKHHKKLSSRVRQLNYKNHIFMYIKNSPWFYPQFFVREFFMFCYILLFEFRTLKVLPEMFRLLPKMWRKRIIINHRI